MLRPETDIEAGRVAILDSIDNIVRQRGAVDISMTELAASVGMSPSNLQRFFESKEALLEAVAERWFADKIQIMEEVCGSDLPLREKMHAFFARRFASMVQQYEAEPELYKSYLEIGNLHFEVVRGYVDLGDHYLSMLVAEAMEEGHFPNLSIDEAVSLINQMIHTYVNPDAIIAIGTAKLNVEKLGKIIDTMFIGLGQSLQKGDSDRPHMKIVS
jgi:AcrR family transcriptional regulator